LRSRVPLLLFTFDTFTLYFPLSNYIKKMLTTKDHCTFTFAPKNKALQKLKLVSNQNDMLFRHPTGQRLLIPAATPRGSIFKALPGQRNIKISLAKASTCAQVDKAVQKQGSISIIHHGNGAVKTREAKPKSFTLTSKEQKDLKLSRRHQGILFGGHHHQSLTTMAASKVITFTLTGKEMKAMKLSYRQKGILFKVGIGCSKCWFTGCKVCWDAMTLHRNL